MLALVVLSLAVFNAGRAVVAFRQAGLMSELGLSGALVALVITGAVWAIGFGAAAIGLYRLKRWARRWLLVAVILYQANLWWIRLTFERSSFEPLTRPADAALSILSVAVVWALLWWPRIRRAFDPDRPTLRSES
jgi:hypothetical protein